MSVINQYACFDGSTTRELWVLLRNVSRVSRTLKVCSRDTTCQRDVRLIQRLIASVVFDGGGADLCLPPNG
jgi:hypothetical protein